MRPFVRYLILPILLFAMVPVSMGQGSNGYTDAELSQDSRSTIRNVMVTGHRKTKVFIIERDVTLQKGVSYSVTDILSNILVTKQNLINTSLFVDVSVSPCNWDRDTLDILIDVKERWYYWPFFYFKPIDRNWNVWINQYDMSFDRLNYGVKIKGDNITGRNDKINLWLINGYTKQIALKYYNPFADRSLKHGYGFELSYAKNREVNYNTSANQQGFFKDEDRFIRERFYAGLTYSYRKGSVNRHTAKLGYWMDRVDDTIVRMNPGFFKKGISQVHYPELQYTFQHLDVDYIAYPSRGKTVEFNFLKRGLGGPMELWQFNLRATRHWTLPKEFFYSVQAEVGVKLPFDQPFVNQPFLGYGDSYLRGLEYYVIDGVAGGFVRNTFRKEVASVKLRTGLKSRTYGVIPFRFYVKAYGDAGYVYNRNNVKGNMLTNKFMYTGGFGVDVLTIYDWVIRFEYSFNQLNERAFFFHKNNE